MNARDPQTFAIIGAAMEVHKTLERGFLEPVYQETLAIEFANRGIPFLQEKTLPIHYKNQTLKTYYRADFICYESIIVELKALQKLSGTEEAQMINYLKASQFKRGLLINFGEASLNYRRFANQKSAQSA